MLLKRMYGIKTIWKYFDLQVHMLFKRIYGVNDRKILWFAISYAFQKDVWDRWYENPLICNFLCLSKGCVCINDMKILWFANCLCFWKGCMG